MPAWLMQTTAECGGLALGAFRHGVLGGFSYAVPCGAHALFSCGLAVLPELARTGRRPAAQARPARPGARPGDDAHPLDGRPARRRLRLTLYLSGLGARLTAYGAELYADVRPANVPPDDVTIEWRVSRARRLPPPSSGAASAARVEVPFDHTALGEEELMRWRLRVRRSMRRALATGAVGTGMAVDRAARRAWVLFEEAER